MTNETKYLSCADTAKLIRQALKEGFPGVKFSVRSSVYSGGASIDVSWVDGPTGKAVEAVAKVFEGARFDGMTDYKGGVVHRGPGGSAVHFGANFIFCHRKLSVPVLQKAADDVAARWGKAAPIAVDNGFGAALPYPVDDDLEREIRAEIAQRSVGTYSGKSATAAAYTVARTY